MLCNRGLARTGAWPDYDILQQGLGPTTMRTKMAILKMTTMIIIMAMTTMMRKTTMIDDGDDDDEDDDDDEKDVRR